MSRNKIFVIGLFMLLIAASVVYIRNFNRDENEPVQIENEIYGSYPKEVPFEQGMTLMPGQSATTELPVFIIMEDDSTTTLEISEWTSEELEQWDTEWTFDAVDGGETLSEFSAYVEETPKPKMFYNYQVGNILSYGQNVILTDMDAAYLIPQTVKSLETYKWYRNQKAYDIEKSILLTIKYWQLN